MSEYVETLGDFLENSDEDVLPTEAHNTHQDGETDGGHHLLGHTITLAEVSKNREYKLKLTKMQVSLYFLWDKLFINKLWKQ